MSHMLLTSRQGPQRAHSAQSGARTASAASVPASVEPTVHSRVQDEAPADSATSAPTAPEAAQEAAQEHSAVAGGSEPRVPLLRLAAMLGGASAAADQAAPGPSEAEAQPADASTRASQQASLVPIATASSGDSPTQYGTSEAGPDMPSVASSEQQKQQPTPPQSIDGLDNSQVSLELLGAQGWGALPFAVDLRLAPWFLVAHRGAMLPALLPHRPGTWYGACWREWRLGWTSSSCRRSLQAPGSRWAWGNGGCSQGRADAARGSQGRAGGPAPAVLSKSCCLPLQSSPRASSGGGASVPMMLLPMQRCQEVGALLADLDLTTRQVGTGDAVGALLCTCFDSSCASELEPLCSGHVSLQAQEAVLRLLDREAYPGAPDLTEEQVKRLLACLPRCRAAGRVLCTAVVSGHGC